MTLIEIQTKLGELEKASQQHDKLALQILLHELKTVNLSAVQKRKVDAASKVYDTLSPISYIYSLQEETKHTLPLSGILQQGMIVVLAAVGLLQLDSSPVSLAWAVLSTGIACLVMIASKYCHRVSTLASSAYTGLVVYQNPTLSFMQLIVLTALLAMESWRGKRIHTFLKALPLALLGVGYHAISTMPSETDSVSQDIPDPDNSVDVTAPVLEKIKGPSGSKWSGKVYISVDTDHGNQLHTAKGISTMSRKCLANPDACMAVIEGGCEPTSGGFRTGVMVSEYSHHFSPQSGAVYDFNGPTTCIGTHRFFTPKDHTITAELQTNIEQGIQELMKHAKILEKLCRQVTHKVSCGFQPGWFKDQEQQWSTGLITQRSYLGRLIQQGVERIRENLAPLGDKIPVSRSEQTQFERAVSGFNELIPKINDWVISLDRAQVTQGDTAAIKAIESLKNQLTGFTDLWLRIGAGHLQKGGKLTQYLERFKQTGTEVRMFMPEATVDNPFRPLQDGPGWQRQLRK